MRPKIRECLSGRLLRGLAAALVLYVCLASSFRSMQLILLLNGLTLSVSAGVAVAYLPVAGTALRRPVPSRGDVLGVGIFLTGLSGVALRIGSILARDLAHPSILNTGFVSAAIFLGLLGLVCSFWAPFASEGRVPREKWGFAGLTVAAGVAVAFAVGTAHHFALPSPLFRFE